MKSARLVAAKSFLLGAAVFLCCLTALHAQAPARKSPAGKTPSSKVFSAQTEHDRQRAQYAAAQNGWAGPDYMPAGCYSSQRLGTHPWMISDDHFKIEDAGRPGFGPRGWVKTSGSWDPYFMYLYHGRPPASIYRMTYRIVCRATGTGPIWTKTSSNGYYTAVARVTCRNGHYFLRFTTVSANAEVHQKSNFFGWSGSVEVQVIVTLPVADP